MSLTASSMLPLGTRAPDFTLTDTISGKSLSLSELKSPLATVIMFICNHCPFVIHVQKQLVQVANTYIPKGVRFIAISSNDIVNYPDDAPEKMQQVAKELHYPFPYLYDQDQNVAKAYDAACTPDFYLFNGQLILVYRGRFDSSRPGSAIPVTGEDLTQALNALLETKPISMQQFPSMGCNIKWK
ncbi:MAG: thioredoxin family protein [Proteobacteria bacterium]|nr:thioredoxin family protein [Pseudomonadota bacterium]